MHGGVAARRCAAGAALESVRHHDPRPHRLVEMHVAVDAARHDQKSRRVDLGGGARQVAGERGDPAVLDADVAFPDVGGRHDGSAANDEIKFHVFLFMPSASDASFMQIAPVVDRSCQAARGPA